MMSKLAFVVVLAAFFGAKGAKGTCSVPYPDGTDKNIFFKECPSSNPWPLQLTHVEIDNNATGQPEYPISLGTVLLMNAQQTLSGTTTYNQVNVDVDLYSWSALVGTDCSWHYVPTFNLLHNLNGCALAGNCPLKPGDAGFKQVLDLGPFGSIIGKLGAGVYQLKIQVKEMDDGAGTYIGCGLIEGQITK